jgi:hypothetical protein
MVRPEPEAEGRSPARPCERSLLLSARSSSNFTPVNRRKPALGPEAVQRVFLQRIFTTQLATQYEKPSRIRAGW